MNKNEYLNGLEKALKEKRVPDVDDILAEYEQHFRFKLADGYSEEEIANKLERPVHIAEQYATQAAEGSSAQKGRKAVVGVGLAFADIVACMVYILFFGWIIAIGVSALAFSATGICLIFGLNIASLIPAMPYLGALILGIAFIALGVLSAVGTLYCYLYAINWAKAYLRWHKTTFSGGVHPPHSGHLNPSFSGHLSISGRSKRRLRNTALVSMLIFGLAFIIGVIVLFVHTGFRPFWHELSWFQ